MKAFGNALKERCNPMNDCGWERRKRKKVNPSLTIVTSLLRGLKRQRKIGRGVFNGDYFRYVQIKVKP